MTISHRKAARSPLLGLAFLVWLLTTFPCVHLRHLYTSQHFLESAHPELFNAYVSRAVWATTALSILGPVLLWFVPARFKRNPEAVFLWGVAIGVAVTITLWAIMVPAFRLLSNSPLEVDNFVYSGLVAGIITGEIHRRALLKGQGGARVASVLKRDFLVAALMIWAVMLKVLECAYLTTVQPGTTAVYLHPVMFLAVVIWVPWICKLFWRREPVSQISSVLRSCIAGVLLPPVVSLVLFVPMTILLYAGLMALYPMVWGIVFLHYRPLWVRALILSPGLVWGVIIGILRWRYLQLEQQIKAQPVAHSE